MYINEIRAEFSMKKLIWTIMILTVTSSAQMKITEQSIINSGEFYYGSGTSQIINEAQDEALSELTKQIAVNIFSSYKEKIKEEDEEVTESTEKILNSYSTATLRNVNFIKKPQEEGTFYVFCYLKKSEVE